MPSQSVTEVLHTGVNAVSGMEEETSGAGHTLLKLHLAVEFSKGVLFLFYLEAAKRSKVWV